MSINDASFIPAEHLFRRNTRLHLAAWRGDTAKVQEIIQAGAMVDKEG
jgi:hypothetical protein